jgi:multimeric flavodoxin WrbA
MDWLLPKIAEADVVYLGTPIYHFNIVHYLQRLRERTLPLAMPEMYVEEGDTHHPARSRNEDQVTVLAAVCGFPDLVNFRQAKGLFPNAVHVFLPASQIISHKEGRKYLEGFMDAVETAGRTLAETGEITDEIRAQLVVDYPEEVKQMIVNQHNEYSASLSTEK